jgi:hypothetical protein
LKFCLIQTLEIHIRNSSFEIITEITDLHHRRLPFLLLLEILPGNLVPLHLVKGVKRAFLVETTERNIKPLRKTIKLLLMHLTETPPAWKSLAQWITGTLNAVSILQNASLALISVEGEVRKVAG